MKESTEQLVLIKERKKSEQIKRDVHFLYEILIVSRKWMKAEFFHNAHGWTPRYTRMLRSKSKGRIISGNEGYRATVSASPDEVRHFIAKTRQQAIELNRQSVEASKYYHAYGTSEVE